MAFRSWTFQMAASPAPPLSPEALMARDGHVDPLLNRVLVHADLGTTEAVEGPDGRFWRVASSWAGDVRQVMAFDVSEAVVAQDALGAADRARRAAGIRELLAAVDPELKLAGPRWAIDGRGDVALDTLEQEAVQAALAGERVVSEEGWAVVPLSSEGQVFATLVRRVDGALDVQRLEAFAVVLSEAIRRRLVQAA